MQKRQEKIVDLITKNKRLSVNHLSKQLGVSQVTIRKDLNQLEETGLLKHKQGFAELADPEDLHVRLMNRHAEKERIAQEAAKKVPDGATIMIESGSACALLAQALGESGKQVNIITISYFIANFVKDYANLSVYLTGGEYQPQAEVVVGDWVQSFLKSFYVDYLFIGTDGFDENNFYSNNIKRAAVDQVMAQQAKQLIVLTDSSKFSHRNTVKQFSLDQVDEIITDRAIPAQAKSIIKKQQIKLHLV